MATNIMLSNRLLGLLALMAVSMPIACFSAEKTLCPASLEGKTNKLVNVRLFDGPVSDNVELAPDNENGATWDIRGYKNSDRTLYLVCDYKNGAHKDVPVAMLAARCYVKGKKQISAWCGK